jgi:hypothetical protein
MPLSLFTLPLSNLSLSFFPRLFVEWYIDLRVFFWCVAGNSLSAKDKYAGFKEQHLPHQIKATAAEFSRANKCLLTFKYGTVNSCQAKWYYSYDDSLF